MEKNEFQNHVFLFSNFLGAAILNNYDVKWLPFCYKSKALCLITKGQPRVEVPFKKSLKLIG